MVVVDEENWFVCLYLLLCDYFIDVLELSLLG